MKHLIVTGDDFGINHKVNDEIERLHGAGLLTQASLMVNGEAVEEAVRVAGRNPRLAVGLHLALCDAKGSVVSAITDSARNLIRTPASAGLRYAFEKRLRPALEAEIRLQFERFCALGFASASASGSGYWDGHTHLHLHPVVMRLALPIALERGFRFTRLVREPRPRTALPLIFHALSRAAAPKLRKTGIGFPDRVYGLSQTGRMDMAAFQAVVGALGEGVSEIYFHPGEDGKDLEPAQLLEEIQKREVTVGNWRDRQTLK